MKSSKKKNSLQAREDVILNSTVFPFFRNHNFKSTLRSDSCKNIFGGNIELTVMSDILSHYHPV